MQIARARSYGLLLRFSPARRVPTLQRAMASGSPNPTAQKVLDYWFGPNWEALGSKDCPDRFGIWFGGGPEVDKVSWVILCDDVTLFSLQLFMQGPHALFHFQSTQEMTALFADDCEAVIQGKYADWQRSPCVHDALAGVIAGDQFCRNIYRGTAKMFAADPIALQWAKDLVVRNLFYSP